MKSAGWLYPSCGLRSHPSRGAWIEIYLRKNTRMGKESHPSRGAWIEMLMLSPPWWSCMSHPSRGAWIEMNRIMLRCMV